MIKLFNKFLLACLPVLLVASVLLPSCKKDKDVESDVVELLSFGPTGAMHGDTLRFIGRNLNQVTSIEFTGDAAIVNQSDFKTQTGELILLLVPQAAEKGYVTLKTPQGDIVSKTQLNLGVMAAVSGFTSSARPGENITINGSYLNWVSKVTFASDKTVETFVSKTFSQLVVTVPDDAETGTLILTYTGTDSADVETVDTLHVALPVATSLSPNPAKHQTNLTITGTNLDLATKIYFTGVANPVTSFVSQTATQIVVTVPAATMDGPLKFEGLSGVQTTSASSLQMVWPSVATMAPNPVDPGADLTITGTNLDLVTSISFENVPTVTSFVSQSATQIVVTVPMGVLRGQIRMGVLNSTVTVLSTDILEITGGPPPPTIAFPFYDDAVTGNWNGWVGAGWGGTSNYNNTSPVRAGTKSIKIDYVGGWGSPLQLGGASVTIAPYTTFKISIYGGLGSNGKHVSIGINGADAYTITLVEGDWTDYAIPISTLTGASSLSEVILKEFDGAGGYSIYVDALGLN